MQFSNEPFMRPRKKRILRRNTAPSMVASCGHCCLAALDSPHGELGIEKK